MDQINKIITSEKFYLPLLYIGIGIIVYYIISYTIVKVNIINEKVSNKIISKSNTKRKKTVIGLINNIIKYIIAIIVIINILNVYKVNTNSILASLGIASVVIGLAFQDIIKDFLAGIFIVFDNAYAVGDCITVDNFNGEVISYNTSKSPNLDQINDMLNKAFDGRNLEGLIFHSDQGWQYQHQSYQQRLKNKGIKQSMSRKGNSMDNGMMENFFGILKTEMFYDQEDKYKTLDELILAIDDYINYYNNGRIKEKLKGLSPVNYRLQSSN